MFSAERLSMQERQSKSEHTGSETQFGKIGVSLQNIEQEST